MDWFLYDNGLLHERVNTQVYLKLLVQVLWIFSLQMICFYSFVLSYKIDLHFTEFLLINCSLFTACLICFCIFMTYIHLRRFIKVSQCHQIIILLINIDQWRITIGLFHSKDNAVIPNRQSSCGCGMEILIFLFFFCSAFVFLILLIVILNPAQDLKLKLKSLNLYHVAIGMSIVYQPTINCQYWRLETLLTKSLNIFESYLDSTVPLDDSTLSKWL